MQLIVLAAGQGSRLAPFTNDRPKTMVEVNGRPIIEHIVHSLSKFKFDSKILVTGYRRESLQYIISKENFQEIYNPEFATSNMVQSLYLALDQIKSDQVLISYSDTIFSSKTISRLLESSHDISIAADLNWYEYWKTRIENPLDDAESFIVNSDGSMQELGKKVKTLDKVQAQYTGLLFFQKKGIQVLKSELIKYGQGQIQFPNKTYKQAYMTDFLQYLIDKKYLVFPSFFKEDWVEIDSVSDLNSVPTVQRVTNIVQANS